MCQTSTSSSVIYRKHGTDDTWHCGLPCVYRLYKLKCLICQSRKLFFRAGVNRVLRFRHHAPQEHSGVSKNPPLHTSGLPCIHHCNMDGQKASNISLLAAIKMRRREMIMIWTTCRIQRKKSRKACNIVWDRTGDMFHTKDDGFLN